MEISTALRVMESRLSTICDHSSAMKAKLEDLLFRAQRIASAQKANKSSNDSMFGHDLQNYRGAVRTFSAEMSGLPVAMGVLERDASPDESAAKLAQAVVRLASRLANNLRSLHDTSILAHQHIRTADHKVEAWFLANEIEELVSHGQGLPSVATRIVQATSAPNPSPQA